MDDADRAQERIEAEQQARIASLHKFNGPSLSECKECGEDIPPKRRALGGVTLCVDCQNYHEVRRK